MSSSLLTLSVHQQQSHHSSNSNNNNNGSSISSSSSSLLSSPVPTSTSTSPCITPQPQTPAVCPQNNNISLPLPSVPLISARNGRKRPALNLPPLHLQSALDHRRQVNESRLRDTKAQIEASFLSEIPSSPGGYSTSSESQPSGSDDDSQNSISALCSSAKSEKRIRFDSTTPSIYSSTVSVDTLDAECNSASSSTKSSSGAHENLTVLGADEYQVIVHGEDFQVLEKSTNNLFQAIKMDTPKYKHFMKVAARIESAKKLFSAKEFRRLKSIIIPSDTRIVHGSHGISYLLMPSHYASLSLRVRDPKNPKARLPEVEVQSIVYQIVEMMELCHQVGLFFGDFKFDKFVFVDQKKTQIRPRSPLIFHLSNEPDYDTLLGTKVGWAFMAPEMLNRRQTSYSGRAADMWALGVLTFTLLVGNYPFVANEPQALFTRIRSRCITHKIENFASPEARIMVYGLLCKNASDRPSALRLKQCHWLKMSPEQFLIMSEQQSSQSMDCTRNGSQQIPLLQFLTQQIDQVNRYQQQYGYHTGGRPGLPRVSSDRRISQAMEHRLAYFRTQSSDQVVPTTTMMVPATANVLFPTHNNSSRICLFSAADSRQ
jgi:serine/threonine protein kinase